MFSDLQCLLQRAHAQAEDPKEHGLKQKPETAQILQLALVHLDLFQRVRVQVPRLSKTVLLLRQEKGGTA